MRNEHDLLVRYINRLEDFECIAPSIPYYNMAATIVDTILQAGLSYNNTVLPRVNRILKIGQICPQPRPFSRP